MLIINEFGEFVEPEPERRFLKLGQSVGLSRFEAMRELAMRREKEKMRSNRRVGKLEPRRCDVCGREFVPKSCVQKRCSKECSKKAQNWSRSTREAL